MTGINADDAANVDRARAAREKILSSIDRKTTGDYTFTWSEQAFTIASTSSLRIERDLASQKTWKLP